MRPVWEDSDNYCTECGATKESDPTAFGMGFHDKETDELICDWCVADAMTRNLRATGETGMTASITIK